MTNFQRWPKQPAQLSSGQEAIREDFMRYWHEVLPRRYSAIERFNHGYPTLRRSELASATLQTLEVGSGLGEHIEYEDLRLQHYTALELREGLARRIEERFPQVEVLVGDVQKRLAAADGQFDRVIAVHVLEHLPDLPSALMEIRRVLKPKGTFTAVIPCEGGLAYEIGRNLTSRRLFEKRYKCSYDWFIRAEHVNTCQEILRELGAMFNVREQVFWPFRVPIIHANAVVGVRCSPRE